MRMKLRELFEDVYDALDELMYSKLIDCETFHKLDVSVKSPLLDILYELEKNKKNQNSGKSSK